MFSCCCWWFDVLYDSMVTNKFFRLKLFAQVLDGQRSRLESFGVQISQDLGGELGMEISNTLFLTIMVMHSLGLGQALLLREHRTPAAPIQLPLPSISQIEVGHYNPRQLLTILTRWDALLYRGNEDALAQPRKRISNRPGVSSTQSRKLSLKDLISIEGFRSDPNVWTAQRSPGFNLANGIQVSPKTVSTASKVGRPFRLPKGCYSLKP